jgi:N-methylhydantoinase B
MNDRIDSIALQVMRANVEAIAAEGVNAIERTAISPVVSEARDASCVILADNGDLIAGGGALEFHFSAGGHAVRNVIRVHADSISPGDVFVGNDPHSDTALHIQDVIIEKPVFVGAELVAWVANSAHMVDFGGMAFGSYAPEATECYQEAIRLPSVRLYRAGVEQSDIWEIIKNNVRLPVQLEMDFRALIAGCNVAEEKLLDLIEQVGGPNRFRRTVNLISERTEEEFRRRILRITDGTYRCTGFTEWDSEFYKVPCELSVSNDVLTFDFEGAAQQAPHFFNSRPWIIKSVLVPAIWNALASDLPFVEGFLRPIEVKCPEGTIVNSSPPAPVASAHSDVAWNADTIAMHCLHQALVASDGGPECLNVTAQFPEAGLVLTTWQFTAEDGTNDGFLLMDGLMAGGPASKGRDGPDLSAFARGRTGMLEVIDVEILESRYPLLVEERKTRYSAFGAGTRRSGAPTTISIRPHGVDRIVGTMIGRHTNVPFLGFAGGYPGSCPELWVHRDDGSSRSIAGRASDVEVTSEEVFQCWPASGGGFGDPIERAPESVLTDVLSGRLDIAEAEDVYGVRFGSDSRTIDPVGTSSQRTRVLKARLAKAIGPIRRCPEMALWATIGHDPLPLAIGVEQRGPVAVAAGSGAPLALSPNDWLDGCPRLSERRTTRAGRDVVTTMYLDPRTGSALCVDAVLDGEPRSFGSRPDRWVKTGEGRRN